MRLTNVFLILAVVIAASPVALASTSNDGANQTEARQAWEAKRDALAEQRLGGARDDQAAKQAATDAMLNAPIRTDDATPVENSDSASADSQNYN